MENKFIDAIEKEVAWKVTENGQTALNTTFDDCLDLFSTIGALRTRSDVEIEKKFAKAYGESPLTAVKMMFYARDIEEGLGERRVFRTCLKYLGNAHPEDVKINFENIFKYGRADDVYALVGTKVEKAAFAYIAELFNKDLTAYEENKPISLLAKWLKSVNTSSDETNKLGKLTAKYFGLSVADYRKILAKLRAKIKVLEVEMSAQKWDTIDFNTVPGGAAKKYVKAFYNHQNDRYTEYLNALKTRKKIKVTKADGTVVEKEAKINTKHLYPYEILEAYNGGYFGLRVSQYKEEYEAMWNGLKDWIDGVESNTIIVADTSGSMSGRPMATSVGLGIYFAERNTGPFHNKFMTFSSKPSWVSLPENSTLRDKVNCIPEIVDNTNLEAAFDLILKTAVQNNLTQEDMPKNLVIITDMEFDSCVCDNSSVGYGWYGGRSTNMTFYDQMKAKYAKFGYTLPEITFWNVNARNDTYHTQKNTPHVRMVSGQATSIFKSLIDGKTHTPYEFMLEVLYTPRYESVVISK